MLIDQSYFIGPLTIAQLGQKAVDDKLKDFISRWEPIIMEAALGYDFYQTFLDGLDVGSGETIDQRWLDLLHGIVFANSGGIKKRWVGFAGGENATVLIAASRDDLTIYAGITPGFAAGGYQYSDASLNGWNFQLELFGAGTLERGVEWNYKTGGGFVLTDTSYSTAFNERWIVHFTSKKTVTVPSGQNLVSPLACFIYYEYMRDLATQSTGIGEVKSEGENSRPTDPSEKLRSVYNLGCRDIQIFWELLQADQNLPTKVYPEFDSKQVYSYGYGGYRWNPAFRGLYSFKPIDLFSI